MNEERLIEIRHDCMNMAVASSGENVEYQYVLDAASAYYSFILGTRSKLRVVNNNDNG